MTVSEDDSNRRSQYLQTKVISKYYQVKGNSKRITHPPRPPSLRPVPASLPFPPPTPALVPSPPPPPPPPS